MSKCNNELCKYNDEGCIFFAQGSGNPEDMPCAEALITKKRVLKFLEEGDPSQIAAQIIHDAIDNTTFAEDAYPGIKEQLHRSVEEWEKLQPVFTEIAEEYKKACEISYINKPLAYALHEVWKKHDRRDTKRNDKRRNESKKGKEPSLQKADRHTDEPGNHKRESVGDAVGVLGCPVLLRRQRGS